MRRENAPMNDTECVSFLQHVMPTLQLQWRGFRKVRKQVCKRIDRRIRELGLSGIEAYGEHLKRDRGEWDLLDSMCRITISRFYRDKGVFGHLREAVLPKLAVTARAQGENRVRIWSAGCASGEEAYTLSLIWQMDLANRFQGLKPEIVATDSDPVMLERAEKACYLYSSLKGLPTPWLEAAFRVENGSYCLEEGCKKAVTFLRQDIRREMPEERFDMILCRNLLFTYFDDALQRKLLGKIEEKVKPGGYLVVGTHESLPKGTGGFERLRGRPGMGIYQRKSGITNVKEA